MPESTITPEQVPIQNKMSSGARTSDVSVYSCMVSTLCIPLHIKCHHLCLSRLRSSKLGISPHLFTILEDSCCPRLRILVQKLFARLLFLTKAAVPFNSHETMFSELEAGKKLLEAS